jgi:plasmid stabilization system protein ParE
MAVEVAWSPEAIEDIESIAAYIERDSSFYAKAVTQKILDLGRSLAAFPRRAARLRNSMMRRSGTIRLQLPGDLSNRRGSRSGDRGRSWPPLAGVAGRPV